MKLSWWKALGGFFLAVALSLPAMGDNTALPGTLNYIEGQASIGTRPLTSKSVGSADLESGQTLTTENGRAEVLLTPGVFLRLDHNSAVKMISPSLTSTQVELDSGRAEIEVAEIHKQNDLQLKQNSATTHLLKTGLYEFSSNPDTVRVIKGEAKVFDGDQTVKVKGGRELDLKAPGRLKAEKFDKRMARDDFYNWSSLRSEYLGEASANAAPIYMNNGWVGTGWYWDPWLSGYTFIPGAGVLYSPFGWGFYSPGVIYSSGLYYGGPYYHGFHHGFYRPAPHGFHEAGHIGEIHSGGFRAGGFHGGGFHGGTFHGGFRGGGRRH